MLRPRASLATIYETVPNIRHTKRHHPRSRASSKSGSVGRPIWRPRYPPGPLGQAASPILNLLLWIFARTIGSRADTRANLPTAAAYGPLTTKRVLTRFRALAPDDRSVRNGGYCGGRISCGDPHSNRSSPSQADQTAERRRNLYRLNPVRAKRRKDLPSVVLRQPLGAHDRQWNG